MSCLSGQAGTVYVYEDDGAESHCVYNLVRSLTFSTNYKVEKINSDKVKEGIWINDAKAFFMPGGADLPYCEKLNGEGNKKIKEFVEKGGVYVGFCAGAYYGSNFCDFHRGDTRGYEVLGNRELSFFDGAAEGPTLADYVYGSREGARTAEIEIEDRDSPCKVYFNGGCHFSFTPSPSIRVLGYYINKERRINDYNRAKKLPAIIECIVGSGKAILCGVHPEFTKEDLEIETNNPCDPYILSCLEDRSHAVLFKKIVSLI